jgi:hypothetical protein
MWESEDRTKRRLMVPQEGQNPGENGPFHLEIVDGRPAIRIRPNGKKHDASRGVVPAILRSTIRQGELIESLQCENEGLQLQTRSLEDAHARDARLILAAEGKFDELVERIETLEEWSWSNQPLPLTQAVPEDSSLLSRLALLETRAETQRRIFTTAHQLQVSTSEEVALLRTTSTRHDQELDALKHSSKREKDWRKYLDTLTKEHKTKIEQLEIKLKREREDKMAMEGHVDAIMKHQQKSSEAMMKKMSALEKLVLEQNAQISMLATSTGGFATEKEMAQSSWMESKASPVKARARSPVRGKMPPRGPSWSS